jgi:hypothetical protein
MPDSDIEKSEDFTTYYCPHCQEPLAVGTLYHLKALCPNCENLFVMVGLGQEDNDK